MSNYRSVSGNGRIDTGWQRVLRAQISVMAGVHSERHTGRPSCDADAEYPDRGIRSPSDGKISLFFCFYFSSLNDIYVYLLQDR
jgi:hypothetical protein